MVLANLQWLRFLVTLFILPAIIAADSSASPDENAQPGHSSGGKSREVGRIRSKRDGSWSDWSTWSPCSRTCGGGIRTQTRQCQLRKTKSVKSSSEKDIFGVDQAILLSRYESRNVSSRHCEGHATRHHLCNTQDCPSGSEDFRETQCKAFDNRPFMGKVYQWESFIDERSPCSLTCRAKGYRFFATLNKSVIDGTSCTKPTQLDLHVCIAGICTPIGCDGVAGSARRLDICGVCGGDNSTCRVVSGLFTRPQLKMGYNLVTQIPKGACKLNISEIKSSSNALALRRQDGSFIINSDSRRPSWPGVYDGAGTRFQYSRGVAEGDMGGQPEIIISAGPLREAVDLMVIYQQPNPGIKYEYILPVGEGTLPQIVQHDSAAPRDRLFGTVKPSQLLKSFSKDGGLLVSQQSHHHHHGHHGRRRGHGGGKRDNSLTIRSGDVGPSGKKFYWKITGYTNCSDVCGGGTQRSIIRCVRAPHGNPVSDRRCSQDTETPPSQTLRCNVKPCPAEWVIGEWGNCSAENCGGGWKTRSVHCEQRISASLKMKVMEAACLQKKPEVRTGCQLTNCYHWTAGEWSECTAKCGNGVRRRVVQCVDSKTGIVVASDECERESALSERNSKRPAEIKACNMGPCDLGVDWFVSEWSKDCSERCGAGIQTRHIVCSGIKKRGQGEESLSNELETNLIEEKVEESSEVYCDQERKPEEERECFSDRMCGEAVWFTGPWGECSMQCGKDGVKTRQVLCVIFSRGKFKVVGDGLCKPETRPTDKEKCDGGKECGARWFTTEWSECSAVCGGGTQKRSVSCRASNWTIVSNLCTDKDRPVERRSCNELKCTGVTSTTKRPPVSSEQSGKAIKKDKPLVSVQQDSGGDGLLEMVAATTTTTSMSFRRQADVPLASRNTSTNGSNYDSLATSNYNISGSTNSSLLRQAGSPLSHSHLYQQHPNEHHDDTEEAECSDQYRNCALVVQARLCRYKYYRSVCCNSCSEVP